MSTSPTPPPRRPNRPAHCCRSPRTGSNVNEPSSPDPTKCTRNVRSRRCSGGFLCHGKRWMGGSPPYLLFASLLLLFLIVSLGNLKETWAELPIWTKLLVFGGRNEQFRPKPVDLICFRTSRVPKLSSFVQPDDQETQAATTACMQPGMQEWNLPARQLAIRPCAVFAMHPLFAATCETVPPATKARTGIP